MSEAQTDKKHNAKQDASERMQDQGVFEVYLKHEPDHDLIQAMEDLGHQIETALNRAENEQEWLDELETMLNEDNRLQQPYRALLKSFYLHASRADEIVSSTVLMALKDDYGLDLSEGAFDPETLPPLEQLQESVQRTLQDNAQDPRGAYERLIDQEMDADIDESVLEGWFQDEFGGVDGYREVVDESSEAPVEALGFHCRALLLLYSALDLYKKADPKLFESAE